MSSVDPDRFIDLSGRPSIKWGLLLSTLVGSWFLNLWSAFVAFLIDLEDALRSILLGLGGAVAVVISRLFGVPIDGVAAAIVETASWLGLFGPLAFPVGVAVTMLTIELTRRGVSRVL